ncbi:vWA domain-containing protein [Zophobihabitans entericus]|uniref:VWA domain-containing protein n=1 Tax=Zophobihabitans entericus TaxID=1635327 RepID=A0A6G9IE12_9GAMM|nr:VWA domain-containing protein [Zophobihabitans entericus]QIQ22067.1 VWA domain-containing protein [Zophobihabitans entericus]
MKIKTLLSVCCLTLTALVNPAQAKTQITVRSELSSPIISTTQQDSNYLKISLTGAKGETEQRSPINLALVIDRSSSMSGDRIVQARNAAILAINLLDKQDTISVVAYDTNAEVLIPATPVVNKEALIKIINDKVHPQGMTALFAGLSRGINQLDKYLNKEQVNRVILLSDGQANIGPTALNDFAELSTIAAKQGISITTIGIGAGYNERLMAGIAGYSDGNHVFINDASDLEKAFVKEFDEVMSVVAQEVTITIKVDENVKPVRLLGREGVIRGNTVTITMNQLYANQEKYALLEVIPATGNANDKKPLASVTVSYDNMATRQSESQTETVMIEYSSSEQKVKEAVIETVLVDSEIQKMALENERALELYNQGQVAEAKAVMNNSTEKLRIISSTLQSAPAVTRAMDRVEANAIFADEMETKDQSIFMKEMTESQYELKQNTNK